MIDWIITTVTLEAFGLGTLFGFLLGTLGMYAHLARHGRLKDRRIRRHLMCVCGNRDMEDVSSKRKPLPLCSADCGRHMIIDWIEDI